jgi:hypothetical protein
MDFGDAIRALKDGKRVSRSGWNGKGMYLFWARAVALEHPPHGVNQHGPYGHSAPEEVVKIMDNEGPTPSICMKTAQNTIVVGWLASQTDMLAEDWEIVT